MNHSWNKFSIYSFTVEKQLTRFEQFIPKSDFRWDAIFRPYYNYQEIVIFSKSVHFGADLYFISWAYGCHMESFYHYWFCVKRPSSWPSITQKCHTKTLQRGYHGFFLVLWSWMANVFDNFKQVCGDLEMFF